MASKLISIENTQFIFKTNFSGDPARDSFGSDIRRVNIKIPSAMQARDMIDEGFNVKQTKPRDGEEEGFVPEYFVSATLNYDTNWPPKVYLVSGGAEPVLMDEETVGSLDMCYIRNVNVILNPYHNPKTHRSSLYVRTMYVEQDISDDPFAARYRNEEAPADELPWE